MEPLYTPFHIYPKMKELTSKEKKYLTVCLNHHRINSDVVWKNLSNADLRNNEIKRITKKFREDRFIEKDSYNLNEEKVDEIKKVLKKIIFEEQKMHNDWNSFFDFKKAVFILIIVFIFGTIFLFNSDITSYVIWEKNSSSNITLVSVTLNLTNSSNLIEDKNKVIYTNKS